jgi:hypothetical protein
LNKIKDKSRSIAKTLTEASEDKDKSKDCFVALLLAMTGEIRKDPLPGWARGGLIKKGIVKG